MRKVDRKKRTSFSSWHYCIRKVLLQSLDFSISFHGYMERELSLSLPYLPSDLIKLVTHYADSAKIWTQMKDQSFIVWRTDEKAIQQTHIRECYCFPDVIVFLLSGRAQTCFVAAIDPTDSISELSAVSVPIQDPGPLPFRCLYDAKNRVIACITVLNRSFRTSIVCCRQEQSRCQSRWVWDKTSVSRHNHLGKHFFKDESLRSDTHIIVFQDLLYIHYGWRVESSKKTYRYKWRLFRLVKNKLTCLDRGCNGDPSTRASYYQAISHSFLVARCSSIRGKEDEDGLYIWEIELHPTAVKCLNEFAVLRETEVCCGSWIFYGESLLGYEPRDYCYFYRIGSDLQEEASVCRWENTAVMERFCVIPETSFIVVCYKNSLPKQRAEFSLKIQGQEAVMWNRVLSEHASCILLDANPSWNVLRCVFVDDETIDVQLQLTCSK